MEIDSSWSMMIFGYLGASPSWLVTWKGNLQLATGHMTSPKVGFWALLKAGKFWVLTEMFQSWTLVKHHVLKV